jgi:hypothetical protein
MYSTNEGICGLIQFEPAARIAHPSSLGDDDTLLLTLTSLAEHSWEATEPSSHEDWTCDSITYADFESLSVELHQIYQGVLRGLR